MKQHDVVQALDEFFAVQDFDESAGWRPFMSDAEYRVLEQFAEPAFITGAWNGLMLDNTFEMERVYLAVFPSRDVLDKIIAQEVARGAPGALIFAHHLTDFEESGRGFVQIPEAQLAELKEHGISFYNCHAPLDCHTEVSTGNALANALGLREQARFGAYYGGYAGVYGTLAKPLSFQAFAARLAKVTDVGALRYDQVRHNGQPVNQIAVVPGGGGEADLIEEAAALGCDTYVTGHWWLFSEKNDYAKNHRGEMRAFIPSVQMNLLAASHYASEIVVMRDQMPAWFRSHGLETELVRQENPWR